MIDVRHQVLEQLTIAGYAVKPGACPLSALRRVMAQAYQDARDVPIDPNGGLPWAYDVYFEDYGFLTAHAVGLMSELGAQTKIARVTMIKKAAGEGRRYWHDDRSPSMPPPDGGLPRDLLVLYYLTPTVDNGCLVVRPGFVAGPCHNDHNADIMMDEVQVPVELGDVVLMDPRLQHASLENKTNADRLLIRVWTENVW